MTREYLWDRSGDDPEIAGLERTLGGLAYSGELPGRLPPQQHPPRRGWWLAAAAVLLATGGAYVATRPATHEPQLAATAPQGWALRGRVGGAQCDGRDTAACTLAVGETIEVAEAVHLEVADIGSMQLAPSTRLGLLASGAHEHRLKLERGTIHATVAAPPRLLVVETAASTAVDLGCSYTLSVDEHGEGFLVVDAGWVALEVPGRAVHVPAGARAETRPGVGPGVPYFTDAPQSVQQAARDLSFAPAVDDAPLAAALRAARPRDSLSLWHLLPRVAPAERVKIVEELARLVPNTPADLATEDLVRLDPAALERLRLHIETSWT